MPIDNKMVQEKEAKKMENVEWSSKVRRAGLSFLIIPFTMYMLIRSCICFLVELQLASGLSWMQI